jgi:hypothetical protein
MRERRTIDCPDCRGTGAMNPDCWVCKGARTIRWRRAVALGWSKGDLCNLDPTDPYCDCPSDQCQGDECGLCGGDGIVRIDVPEIEITRALIFLSTGAIPPRYERAESGRLHVDTEALLSVSAARICEERGWGWRLNSIFGHEFHARDAGLEEAARRMPAWVCAHDSDNRSIDWHGRLADDGSTIEEREWD